MINFDSIYKAYRTDTIETTALNNVDLEIKKGEFVSIMGPSGCGKSTLMNIMGLLDKSDGGSYKFNDVEVSYLNEKERTKIRKDNIGFVFQSFNLIDELNVFENIELPLLYQKMNQLDRQKRVLEMIDKMELQNRDKHYPQQLSGGQQQRVAVARALVTKPEIILADEPTGNLDSKNGKQVMELLKKMNEEGTTIVMVTHSEEYATYAPRIIRMLDGEIVNSNEMVEV